MIHGSTNNCPDPETLAAWVDQGLHGDERTRVEHHAAGCARCQAHLATMARMASAEPTVTEPRTERHLWRWLVPAAAGITAVAIWVLVLPPPQPESSTAPAQPARPAPLENRARATDAVAAPELDARATEQKASSAQKDSGAQKDNRALRRERVEIQNQTADARKEIGPAAAAPRAQESAAMRYLGPPPIEIVSPDSSTRWRAIRSVVERSIDGGATWYAQRLDIAEHLTAGSAPSATVAWIVGQRGVVLLTTDGLTWRRVPFPESIDLVSVQASDATHATVTTSDGRTFVTADATLWSPR